MNTEHNGMTDAERRTATAWGLVGRAILLIGFVLSDVLCPTRHPF